MVIKLAMVELTNIKKVQNLYLNGVEMTVGVNNFVRRQIKGSGKTYSKTLSFKDLIAKSCATSGSSEKMYGFNIENIILFYHLLIQLFLQVQKNL